MKKLLLHIGSPKTGSTSIQKVLSSTSFDQIVYPNLGGIDHNRLIMLYMPFQFWLRGYKTKYKNYSPEDLNKVKDDVRKKYFEYLKNNDNIIISAECIFNTKCFQIEKIKTDLLKFGFNDIRVVAYVREPSKQYLSSMQQKLKASSSIINPNRYKYHFKEAIENWEKVFGKALIVKPYDISKLYNNDIVFDFLQVCGSYFGKTFKIDQYVYSNKNFSAEEMIIISRYRKMIHPDDDNVFMPDSNKLQKVLSKIIQEKNLKTTKPILKQDVINVIRNNHYQDLVFLQEKYEIDFINERMINDVGFYEGFKKNEAESILESFEANVVSYLLFAVLEHGLKK